MGSEGISSSVGDVHLKIFPGLYFNLFWISDGLDAVTLGGKISLQKPESFF